MLKISSHHLFNAEEGNDATNNSKTNAHVMGTCKNNKTNHTRLREKLASHLISYHVKLKVDSPPPLSVQVFMSSMMVTKLYSLNVLPGWATLCQLGYFSKLLATIFHRAVARVGREGRSPRAQLWEGRKNQERLKLEVAKFCVFWPAFGRWGNSEASQSTLFAFFHTFFEKMFFSDFFLQKQDKMIENSILSYLKNELKK